MTSTSASPVIAGRPGPGTFDSLDPATGEVVGTYPVHDADAVEAAARSGSGVRVDRHDRRRRVVAVPGPPWGLGVQKYMK